MGNEQSGEENKNKFVKSGIDINESSFGYCENTSSYKGMKFFMYLIGGMFVACLTYGETFQGTSSIKN